ncbi:MAG: hypothetical protein GTN67_14175 [Hydrotalea flava]|uniref:hypothetical protein n=1 Tax=Hydrotalea flava TaxID=714549 RepID=UPI00082B8AEC|nr:hypothetical protein [Hydrotalea flava]RTL49853.1 MAG: hypothetical protein EKK39_10460 [Sphingobacteriales bacterium]GHU75005.1 hypothetical protein FACS189461_0400 [Spirochaetia bacterium]NIM36437.1 hypothetical protein [Hydrotalea flava]NIM39295.1 hypothetical protein [Hydrotalea flava]NIN04221.1 hypothetical protein [Hydrotalea flava]
MEININNIDMAAYEKIKQSITSKDSVVGIDAVHTHILIIHKLMQIEQQLQQLQQRLDGLDK